MHPLNDPNNVNALPDTTPILRALNRWRNGMDELATPEEFLAVLAAGGQRDPHSLRGNRMTEQDTTTVDTDPAPADTDANGAAPTDAPQGQGNREARYRVERNEARAEVANLQARLAIIQRAEIERLASAGLSHPSDIFTLSGNELADYLTEDGDVDTEKVSADVASILGERPGLKPPAPAVDRTQGHGGSTGRGVPSFSDLLSS